MTKKKIKTVKIDKVFFNQVLKMRGYSIRQLGEDKSVVSASDKTIRRQLNKGEMRTDYIDEIAQFINVDTRVLTGELFFSINGKRFFPLGRLAEYPYNRKEIETIRNERMKETLSGVLSLFNRSYFQYEQKEYIDQLQLQEELFSAMEPVIYKHLNSNAFGKAGDYEDHYIICEIEAAIENYKVHLYADTTVRQSFLENPPKGYTKRQIQRMTPEELIDLSESIDNPEPDPETYYSNMREQLMENLPEGYTKEKIANLSDNQLEHLFFFGS